MLKKFAVVDIEVFVTEIKSNELSPVAVKLPYTIVFIVFVLE